MTTPIATVAYEAPTLRRSRLVDEFRELGLEIDISLRGERRQLPAGVDQSAFRIIQEALTNTLKHAGRTRIDLELVYTDADLQVTIRDHGGRRETLSSVRSPRPGRGIIGMRERVALFDGEIDATPHADGGFAVSARLPLNGSRKT